jgi:Transglutaminase-like superfamily
MRILTQLLSLSGEDLLQLLRFKCQIAAVRIALSWTPISNVARCCELSAHCPGAGLVDSFDRTRIERVVRLVDIAARRGLLKGSCLVRSIVLKCALAELGIRTELRIGVHKNSVAVLAAHAWLEMNGEPINDRADIRTDFAVFETTLSAESETRLGKALKS